MNSVEKIQENKSHQTPLVLISILAKEKSGFLPLYLECLFKLNYPKNRIGLFIRSNNNKDSIVEILKQYVTYHGNLYHEIYEDYSDVSENVEDYGEHEWNSVRFEVLGKIRQKSLMVAYENNYDYYFVIDCDNFIVPDTLTALINSNKDVIGPFIKKPHELYSNYHHCTTENGYFKTCPEYSFIHSQKIKGLIEVDVIHCTYLIRTSVIPKLRYLDGTGRHEYVIFSESCRENQIPQYIDNTRVWGWLTFHPNQTFREDREKEFRIRLSFN